MVAMRLIAALQHHPDRYTPASLAAPQHYQVALG